MSILQNIMSPLRFILSPLRNIMHPLQDLWNPLQNIWNQQYNKQNTSFQNDRCFNSSITKSENDAVNEVAIDLFQSTETIAKTDFIESDTVSIESDDDAAQINADFILRNHGDVKGMTEAKKLLAKAQPGTWILRRSKRKPCYKMTKKTDSGCENCIQRMRIEDILKGESRDFKLWDMFVNEEILHAHPYNYGKLSNQKAEQKLQDTPIGSWLFHFSEKDQQFAFSIHLGNHTYKHILIAKDKCHQTSLRTLFEDANETVKSANGVAMRQNIAGIPVHFFDPKQAEEKVTELFETVMQKDPKVADEFKKQGFTKLSRRKFNALPTSYLIEDNSSQTIKIHQVIHGPGALLGRGTCKNVKVTQNLNRSQGNLVISKYYGYLPTEARTLIEIEAGFPELRQILEILRKMQYMAKGSLISLGGNAFLISEYAKTSLDKLIKKGLTEDLKKKYALHLLTGLASLHANQIAHRDIKPPNINIIENAETHEDEACHADFDYATRQKITDEERGTPTYQPHEILLNLKCSLQDLQKGDIYAMGMVLYEMYHQKHLWYDESLGDTGTNFGFYLQYRNSPDWADEFLKKFPEPKENTIDHLIWQMLHPNPSLRPTAQGALDQFKKLIKEN